MIAYELSSFRKLLMLTHGNIWAHIATYGCIWPLYFFKPPTVTYSIGLHIDSCIPFDLFMLPYVASETCGGSTAEGTIQYVALETRAGSSGEGTIHDRIRLPKPRASSTGNRPEAYIHNRPLVLGGHYDRLGQSARILMVYRKAHHRCHGPSGRL